MDYRYETDDSARDFHRNRRAFIILNDELLFLPRNSALSHYEFCQMFNLDRDEFNSLCRGYYFDGRVVFYKDNFVYDETLIENALRHLPEICLHVEDNVVCIYFGQLPEQDFALDYFYGWYINGDIIPTDSF